MGSRNPLADATQWNGYRKWPWAGKNVSRVKQKIAIENIIIKRVITYAVCEWAALAS